eukprot:COSAG04_NODE_3059_length_3223_cov_4.698464_3_plen_75_part_00
MRQVWAAMWRWLLGDGQAHALPPPLQLGAEAIAVLSDALFAGTATSEPARVLFCIGTNIWPRRIESKRMASLVS